MLLILAALVVCIPILLLTLLGALAVSLVLSALGVPDAIGGFVVFVFGFGGGLVLAFLALLWISRRLPDPVRGFLYGADEHARSISGVLTARDPGHDSATLIDRVRAADATLAPADDTLAAADAAIASGLGARREDDRPDGG
jgi:hypothetical protein